MNEKRFFRLLASAVVCAAAVSLTTTVSAVDITVVNVDGAGEGLNDPTPFTPEGGNTATTVGEARLNALQHAADIWGACLDSSVPIIITSKFDPLTCTASSALLGFAGPATFFRDFPNATPSVWYPVALANSIAGSDLNVGAEEIISTFNSNVGVSPCFTSWYYGLDANPPAGKTDLVTVALHEFGHGLGFSTTVDLTTGAKGNGFDDVYMQNLEGHGTVPPDFPSMSDGQRVAAMVSGTNLHWTGSSVLGEIGSLTGGTSGGHVKMYAPNPAQPGSSVSHFDTSLAPNQLMEPSYTGALHNVDLSLNVMEDIGWTLLGKGGGGPGPGVEIDLEFVTNQGAVLSFDHFDDGTLNPSWRTVGSPGPESGTSLHMESSQFIFHPLAGTQPEDTLAFMSMDLSTLPDDTIVALMLYGPSPPTDRLSLVIANVSGAARIAWLVDETGILGATVVPSDAIVNAFILISPDGHVAAVVSNTLVFLGTNTVGTPSVIGILVH